jgi:Phage integrase, N-terminal SAM-like domain
MKAHVLCSRQDDEIRGVVVERVVVDVAQIKLSKRRGDLASLDAGKEPLVEFAAEWWELYAKTHLAEATLRHYARLRDRYVVPALGRYELRRLSPRVIQHFVSGLEQQGVGSPTIRKTLAMLQGMMERAVEWGRRAH